MKISYSAPAKIILSGEHAVVYGKPALVSAIDLRIKGIISEIPHPKKQDRNTVFIEGLVRAYLDKQKIAYTIRPYSILLSSEIPKGRGLGSSASYSVVMSALLLEYFTGEKNFNKEVINSIAYQAEKRFHSNPSGVDQTTSCFGGLVFFRKEFEFLKGIYALESKIPKNIEETLFLIDTGKPKESTSEMVSHVGASYNKDSEKIDDTFQKIEKITKRLTVAIVKEDVQFFQKSMKENEEQLEKLGVVSESTKKLIKDLLQFGVGKITGAGGIKNASGYILFSTHNKEGLEKFCAIKGISIMKFKQSDSGLQRL